MDMFNQDSEISVAERKEALKKQLRPYGIRLLIVLVISFALAAGFNELAFAFQREAFDRAPDKITIEIPRGTAERVERGETPPEIPADLTFVVGDTLEVVNKDTVSHQLGPLFIPAGTAARLLMENPDKLTYRCSFRTNEYLGVDVKQSTTLGIRLTGLMLAAPTTAAIFFLYSLVMFPIKSQKENSSADKIRDHERIVEE
jgi:hypothetical protein